MSRPCTAAATTADGSATAPSDYAARALSGQTIPAGSDHYAFAVSVNGDTTVEPDETFHVRVSMPGESLRRVLREAGLEPHAVGL